MKKIKMIMDLQQEIFQGADLVFADGGRGTGAEILLNGGSVLHLSSYEGTPTAGLMKELEEEEETVEDFAGQVFEMGMLLIRNTLNKALTSESNPATDGMAEAIRSVFDWMDHLSFADVEVVLK